MAKQETGRHGTAAPCDWVARFIDGVRPGGRVLDVACGAGRHIALALDHGLRVTGIDRDLSHASRFEARPDVALIEADLEIGAPFPVAGRTFDCVLVTNYLWRPVLPDIMACVAEDGFLIYETFAVGQERLGRPTNPDFLLRPNELLDLARPTLTVVAYEHGLVGKPEPRLVQRVAACGQAHHWAGGRL